MLPEANSVSKIPSFSNLKSSHCRFKILKAFSTPLYLLYCARQFITNLLEFFGALFNVLPMLSVNFSLL